MKNLLSILFVLLSTLCFSQQYETFGSEPRESIEKFVPTDDFLLISELVEIRLVLNTVEVNLSSKAVSKANIDILRGYIDFAVRQIYIMQKHLSFLSSYKYKGLYSNIEKINELKSAINFQQEYLVEARKKIDDEKKTIKLYNTYKNLMLREREIRELLNLGNEI